jgi:hypothetical protein
MTNRLLASSGGVVCSYDILCVAWHKFIDAHKFGMALRLS